MNEENEHLNVQDQIGPSQMLCLKILRELTIILRLHQEDNIPSTLLVTETTSNQFYFLTEGYLLYNVVLFSAIQQCKSVIILYIYMYIYTYLSPPPFASLPLPIPPLQVITGCQAGLPGLYSRVLLDIYVMHDSGYMSMLLSQLTLPLPSPAVSTSPFPTSVSPFLLTIPSSRQMPVPSFLIPHIRQH